MMPQAELDERTEELGHAALQALLTIQTITGDKVVCAIQQLAELGDLAHGFLADYYDAMTEDELLEGCSDKVEIGIPEGGPKVSFSVAFTGEELALIRGIVGRDHRFGEIVHNAAMAYIDHCDEKGWRGDDAGL